MRDLGPPERVVSRYLAAMSEKDAAYLHLKHKDELDRPAGPHLAPEVVTTIPNIDHRFGDARAEVLGIRCV